MSTPDVKVHCAAGKGPYRLSYERELLDTDGKGLVHSDTSIYSSCRSVVSVELKEPVQGTLVILLGVTANNKRQGRLNDWVGVFSRDGKEITLDADAGGARLKVRHLWKSPTASAATKQSAPLPELDPSNPVAWLAASFKQYQAKHGEQGGVVNFLADTNFYQALSALVNMAGASSRKSDQTVRDLLMSFKKVKEAAETEAKRSKNSVAALMNDDIEKYSAEVYALALALNRPRGKARK